MSESYLTSQTDQRTLGTMVDRLLDDLNRPDLQAEALEYIQDSIRNYQRKAWLFNELDNSATLFWIASTNYPQGTTIQVTISGTLYAFIALTAGVSGSSTPAFPTSVFTVPQSGTPPPPAGSVGTVVDNTIVWANAGLWSSSSFTQLCTVYNINQYVPPLDYVAPYRIEVTAANLRFQLQWISYNELRDYDVIRPAPITVYPTFWAWFQQQIYTWPYPNGFYPLTLSYRTAPPIIGSMANTNFWTQIAEGMVRADAARRICLSILHDTEAADDYGIIQKDEERSVRSMAIAQRSPSASGIPASDW